MDFWSQIIPRRRSEFSRPRLAVFCGQKTLLRLTKAKKTGAVQSFWAHAFVPRGGFEPPTISLRGSCSTNWANRACLFLIYFLISTNRIIKTFYTILFFKQNYKTRAVFTSTTKIKRPFNFVVLYFFTNSHTLPTKRYRVRKVKWFKVFKSPPQS